MRDASAVGKTAEIAVIVVTWNSAGVIKALLDSLPAGLEGLGWHLNVVDNDSADETAALVGQWAAEHPDVRCRLVQTGYNAGYSIAINAGLSHADPYTASLILNPDLRLHAGCAQALVDALAEARAGHGIGIVVPLLYDEHGELSKSLRREPSVLRALGEAVLGARAGRFGLLGEVVLDDEAYRRPSVVDWATGAAMLISADCLAESGPWDESFFLYSEETEFALRARDLGYATRLAPDASAMPHRRRRRSLADSVDPADPQPRALLPAPSFAAGHRRVLVRDLPAGTAARSARPSAQPERGACAAQSGAVPGDPGPAPGLSQSEPSQFEASQAEPPQSATATTGSPPPGH